MLSGTAPIIFTLLIIFCNFGSSAEMNKDELDGDKKRTQITVTDIWGRILDFCQLPEKCRLATTCVFVRDVFHSNLTFYSNLKLFEELQKSSNECLTRTVLLRLCCGREPALPEGRSSSSLLWQLAYLRYKKNTADLTTALGYKPEFPEVTQQERTFATAILDATIGMDDLPGITTTLKTFRKLGDEFRACVDCTKIVGNSANMLEFLRFTNLPAALANGSELNEMQVISLELARAYKRLLCFRGPNGEPWYLIGREDDTLVTLLRGPDFPSNPSQFKNEEETREKMKSALKLTDDFVEKLATQATKRLAAARRALLS